MKTGTKFVIRDTAQCMGKHTRKQFIYPTQKHSRDTHSESVWTSFLMRETAVSQKLGRDIRPEWSGGHPE